MAFRCGVAFVAGARFSVGLRFVSEDEDLKYRTADNGNVIAIKDGEVVGGAGASVGPDKIPSFEFFSASEEQKGEGFTKRVRQYVETYVRDKVEAQRHPKGMSDDCERIVMGPKQIRELTSLKTRAPSMSFLKFGSRRYKEAPQRRPCSRSRGLAGPSTEAQHHPAIFVENNLHQKIT
jgi:hypothetical protein